jgi:hypothetical protein
MTGSVIQARESFVVQRPTLDAVVDTFRDLLHLPPRHKQGFIAHGDRTFVETIIDHEQSGIGPISVSTDTPRFFAYTVRYEDNTLGLMTITGRSVSSTFRDGSTPRALHSIFQATEQHGPITRHSLFNIVTPAIMHDSVEGFAVLQARTHLHQLIFDASKFESISIPPLSLSKIILRGWPEHGSQLPSCIFHTVGRGDLWARLAWGPAYQDAEMFRLV